MNGFLQKWNSFERKVTSKLDDNQKKLWEVLVFLLRFLLLAIPFHFLLWINFDALFLQKVTVRIVSSILSLFGVVHETGGVYLFVPLDNAKWTIEIVKDCVGWKSFMAVSGLMFAVRDVKLAKRIKGIIVAAPIIFLGNSIRIFTSIYIATIFGYEWFGLVHDVLWQGGLIALVLAIWWIWLTKYASAEE